MKPVARHPAGKMKHKSTFVRNVKKTKAANLMSPNRGGWRL